MKLSQKQEIEELKKKHVEMARLLIVLSGYYTHLEDDFEKDIQALNHKIDRLERLVQKLIVTR